MARHVAVPRECNLVDALRKAEQRKAPPVGVCSDRRQRTHRATLADWRQLLTGDIATGREVLRLLLDGPIRFTPIVEERRRGYAFEGAIAFDRMLEGVVDFPPCVASPTGFEPVF